MEQFIELRRKVQSAWADACRSVGVDACETFVGYEDNPEWRRYNELVDQLFDMGKELGVFK